MPDHTALGIHAHPNFKLGLRPPEPGRPALRLVNYLTGRIPDHPDAVDYLQGIEFGLYLNSKYGVCGPCSVANSRRLITARLKGKMETPSQDDVFDLYRRSGNPNFDPATGADDNGVNMQTMLDAVLKGGIGGVKCLGYARVNASSVEELEAAVALFGSVNFGVLLETAQQSQTDHGTWDYQRSPVWGGHAVLGGAYRSSPSEQIDVITWAQRVHMTQRFIQAQSQEAWVIIWPEHLAAKGFLEGIDLRSLAADYEAITGRPFPAPVPPPAPPAPNPTPSPVAQGRIIVSGGPLTLEPGSYSLVRDSGPPAAF